ncbi:hypothetical protein F5B21DRAFT_445067 [Xylaria acuta]|nr:hypothetical protein F5B21DRAFT_445067 [Xylaria acuta]
MCRLDQHLVYTSFAALNSPAGSIRFVPRFVRSYVGRVLPLVIAASIHYRLSLWRLHAAAFAWFLTYLAVTPSSLSLVTAMKNGDQQQETKKKTETELKTAVHKFIAMNKWRLLPAEIPLLVIITISVLPAFHVEWLYRSR